MNNKFFTLLCLFLLITLNKVTNGALLNNSNRSLFSKTKSLFSSKTKCFKKNKKRNSDFIMDRPQKISVEETCTENTKDLNIVRIIPEINLDIDNSETSNNKNINFGKTAFNFASRRDGFYSDSSSSDEEIWKQNQLKRFLNLNDEREIVLAKRLTEGTPFEIWEAFSFKFIGKDAFKKEIFKDCINVEFLGELLDFYGNFILNEFKPTLAHYCVKRKGCTRELLELFEEKNIRFNVVDSFGASPFLWLLKNKACNLNMINFFLEREFDINERDILNRGALHYLAKNGDHNYETSVFLLKGGLDINATDAYEKTPLHYLAKSKNCTIENFKIFLGAGANLNLQDDQQETPLHSICRHNPQFYIFFLKNGANPNIINEDSQKPIECIYDKKERIKLSNQIRLMNID